MSRSAKFLLVALCLTAGLEVVADERTISDAEAKHHVGQVVAVRGVVANVFVSAKGNTFLNFGAPYPNQTFSGVIFSENADAFPNPQQWEGRRVLVRGRVKLYKGRPEIIVRTPSQVASAE